MKSPGIGQCIQQAREAKRACQQRLVTAIGAMDPTSEGTPTMALAELLATEDVSENHAADLASIDFGSVAVTPNMLRALWREMLLRDAGIS